METALLTCDVDQIVIAADVMLTISLNAVSGPKTLT